VKVYHESVRLRKYIKIHLLDTQLASLAPAKQVALQTLN
jgi:hypothetical protein